MSPFDWIAAAAKAASAPCSPTRSARRRARPAGGAAAAGCPEFASMNKTMERSMRTFRVVVAGAIVCAAVLAARPARADCFEDAARYQHVNPTILRAIAWVESHGHADARHVNAD